MDIPASQPASRSTIAHELLSRVEGGVCVGKTEVRAPTLLGN